jgi:hypothetical protein
MDVDKLEIKNTQPVAPIVPVKPVDKGIKKEQTKQIFNYRKRMIARNKETIIYTS